jgi:hypothetical protein
MKNIKNKDLRCEYSGLPSPQAYIKKHKSKPQNNEKTNSKDKNIVERFFIKKQSEMKRLIQKILLWWSYKKPKKRNKSIWDL